MKILALLTDAYDAPGGIAQYNRDLLEALDSSEQITSVLCLVRYGRGNEETPAKINQLEQKNSKLSYSLSAIRQAVKLKPDVVFCGHINLLPIASLTAFFTGARIWLQLHGIDAWEKTGKLVARLVANAAMVTCVSRYTRRRFLQWANIDPLRVKVLPNTIGCVNESTVSSPSPPGGEGWGEGGVPSNKKILLTVGRLSASEQYKGQDLVIKCLPGLIEKDPNIHYMIAGDGDDLQRLKDLADHHGVSGNVSFVGYIQDEKLEQLYSKSDLFVMPSTGEGFGIVFLEAMAHGVPALGLNEDGSMDPLQDGRLGIVATKESLCDEIIKALNSKTDTELASRVQSVFGKQNFNQHVCNLLHSF